MSSKKFLREGVRCEGALDTASVFAVSLFSLTNGAFLGLTNGASLGVKRLKLGLNLRERHLVNAHPTGTDAVNILVNVPKFSTSLKKLILLDGVNTVFSPMASVLDGEERAAVVGIFRNPRGTFSVLGANVLF